MQFPLPWIVVKTRLLSFRLVQSTILQPDIPSPGKKLRKGVIMDPSLRAKPPALQNLDGTGPRTARCHV